MLMATHSVVRRIALQLGAGVALLLGAISIIVYLGVQTLHEQAQSQLLAIKVQKLVETSSALLRPGTQDFLDLLQTNAVKRQGSRLELRRADGTAFYQDSNDEAHTLSAQVRSRRFELRSADGQIALTGRFDIDISQDEQRQQALAHLLALATAIGALLSAGLAIVVVRRDLHPLRHLAAQTQAMSASGQLTHLQLSRHSTELAPLVEQFNELIDRLETGRTQLEAFNADVAHELRTPLTALIGKTELALSRPRAAPELARTLESNLEELGRMASVVNDMLFLARADGGQRARMDAPHSLGRLISELFEYHEAHAAQSGLRLALEGELFLPVDDRLVQRGVSNLLSNACRYAKPGTTVRVVLTAQGAAGPSVSVVNQGTPIPEAVLPRLFDRFYRADSARQREGMHAGLGLAIVAAIARMHGGGVWAHSTSEGTEVGIRFGSWTGAGAVAQPQLPR